MSESNLNEQINYNKENQDQDFFLSKEDNHLLLTMLTMELENVCVSIEDHLRANTHTAL